jgi:hypothetical protein
MEQVMTLHPLTPVSTTEFPRGAADTTPLSSAQAVTQMCTAAFTKALVCVFVGWMLTRNYTPTMALLTASGCMAIAFGLGATSTAGKKVATKFGAALKATVN